MTHIIEIDTPEEAVRIRPVNCTFGEDYTPIHGFETNARFRPDVISSVYVPSEGLVIFHIGTMEGDAQIHLETDQALALLSAISSLLTESEQKQ